MQHLTRHNTFLPCPPTLKGFDMKTGGVFSKFWVPINEYEHS